MRFSFPRSYDEVVQHDTPRLVVSFKIDDGNELFQWGMGGQLPAFALIGYISHVQRELMDGDWNSQRESPNQELMIAWDRQYNKYEWYIHQSAPVESMIGMLEIVKATLVANQLMQQQRGGTPILGPDGLPIKR